jgi:hypothetical protein
MGHHLWEKIRCQHKLSAPSSLLVITHQSSKGRYSPGVQTTLGEQAARDHGPFGPEQPAWVIYSPQAKGFHKEEREPCARIKASRRWPMKS